MTVFEIMAAISGAAAAVVAFMGVVATTLHVSKISSKLDVIVAKMDETAAVLTKVVDCDHNLGERAAKLEGRVDELSRRGVPPKSD